VNFQKVLSDDVSDNDDAESKMPKRNPELPFAFGFRDRTTGKMFKPEQKYG
jgi:hypothetical protein